MQKLTLRIEPDLVKDAKEYAASHGKSLSQLVAEYFNELTRQTETGEKLPPLTRNLKGILAGIEQAPDQNDYKQYLEDKYL